MRLKLADSITPPVADGDARPIDPACGACKKKSGHCQYAPAVPGCVYVLLDSPPSADNTKSLDWLRATIAGLAHGKQVVFDFAVRCRGAKDKDMVRKCRPYTLGQLDAKPSLIIIAGRRGQDVLLGRNSDPYAVSGASGYARGIPYLLIDSPRLAFASRHRRDKLAARLKWALKPGWRPLVLGDPYAHETHVVVDEDDAICAQYRARDADWVCFDCETYSRTGNDDFRLLSVAIAFDDGDDSFVWDEAALYDRATAQPLINILTGAPLVGHNLKYDLVVAFTWMQQMRERNCFAPKYLTMETLLDTQVTSRLFDTEAAADLETVAEKYGWGAHKLAAHRYVEEAADELRAIARRTNAAVKKGKSPDPEDLKIAQWVRAKSVKAYCYSRIPRDELLRYNALDTLITAYIARDYLKKLNQPKNKHLANVWTNVVAPAVTSYAQIEWWGIVVDRAVLDLTIATLEAEKAEALARCQSIAGVPGFNPGSPDQVARLLFNHTVDPLLSMSWAMGLEPPRQGWVRGTNQVQGLAGDPTKKTPTGKPSTDDDALSKISHPIVDAILGYRDAEKKLGTYGYGVLAHVRDDGRIHSTFRLDGARTGRTSSKDPNMQNQTKFSKRYYRASPNCTIVELDYSQMEFRIAADISGDRDMIQLYKDGTDVHLSVAKRISQAAWGIPPEDVTSEHRRQAKRFVFGMLYGMTINTLATNLGLSRTAAQAMYDAILGAFKSLDRTMRKMLLDARKTGRTYTFWAGERGRERNLHDISSTWPGAKINAENAAFNTAVQGTANEYCTASAVEIVRWIQRHDVRCRVIATIHDAVILDCHRAELPRVVHKCKQIMESWPTMSGVPLQADIKIGPRLSDLEKCTIEAIVGAK